MKQQSIRSVRNFVDSTLDAAGRWTVVNPAAGLTWADDDYELWFDYTAGMAAHYISRDFEVEENKWYCFQLRTHWFLWSASPSPDPQFSDNNVEITGDIDADVGSILTYDGTNENDFAWIFRATADGIITVKVGFNLNGTESVGLDADVQLQNFQLEDLYAGNFAGEFCAPRKTYVNTVGFAGENNNTIDDTTNRLTRDIGTTVVTESYKGLAVFGDSNADSIYISSPHKGPEFIELLEGMHRDRFFNAIAYSGMTWIYQNSPAWGSPYPVTITEAMIEWVRDQGLAFGGIKPMVMMFALGINDMVHLLDRAITAPTSPIDPQFTEAGLRAHITEIVNYCLSQKYVVILPTLVPAQAYVFFGSPAISWASPLAEPNATDMAMSHNAWLYQTFYDDPNVYVIECTEPLREATTSYKMIDEYSEDGIHMTHLGQQVYADAISRVLTNIHGFQEDGIRSYVANTGTDY